MDAPFTRPNSSANSRDILKSLVKEPSIQENNIVEVLSAFGHLRMLLIWPREDRKVLVELGDYVGSAGEPRKTFPLARHVGSPAKGTSNRSLTSAQGSTQKYFHVLLHTWWNLCPSVVPRLMVGMDTFRNIFAHLLQIFLQMQLPWSYNIAIRPLRHPSVHVDFWEGSPFHVTSSDGGINWHSQLVCLNPCTFIRMYNIEKALHVLKKFSMDKLVM